MFNKIPKPLLFGILGAIGCLVGWVLGEPVLKVLSPAENVPAGGTAPVSRKAPNLLFSNPVMQQVTTERGAHQGAIKIGLLWRNINDLDLHCIDPSGEEISYQHKASRSGGELDIDCNVNPPYRNPGAEHIYWKEGSVPEGTYKVFVNHYNNKGGSDPTPFEVEILVEDRIFKLAGSLQPQQNSEMREFTISKGSNSTLIHDSGALREQFDWKALFAVGFWGALLAIPLAGALVMGQNALQHRALLQAKQRTIVLRGGLIAGFVSGFVSQYFFASLAQKAGFATSALFLGAGQTVGWIVLGGLLGLAMTFFIPNLPRRFAIPGGVIGGLIGGLAFVLANRLAGDVTARAIGAASVGFGIGAMIAIAEKIAREAALIVHWGPNERSIINLGPKPIMLGSSPEADLYLPKEKGFPLVTALVTFIDGRIAIENKIDNTRRELRNGSRLQLGELAVEVEAK